MTAETKQIGAAVLALGGKGATHVGAAKASPYVNRIARSLLHRTGGKHLTRLLDQ